MSTPSDRPQGPPREGAAESNTVDVEAALDEALDETFPASDPINLHQWSELEQEDAAHEAAGKTADPKAAPTPAEPAADEHDRVAAYLRGPTAYCA